MVIKRKDVICNFCKEKFKNKNIKRERISQEFVNYLLIDPERNISIGNWYSENELREKADIHRARLSKFGKSKMNGEMLFLGPENTVYRYNQIGEKIFL